MQRLVANSRFLLPFIILSALFWAMQLVTPREITADLVNGMLISLSFTVVWAYAAPTWEAMRAKQLTRVHHLVVGIVLAWAVVLGTSIFRYTYANLDRPVWLIDHPVVFYLYFVLCLSAVLHLTAPNDTDKVRIFGFSRTSARMVVFAFILGAFLSFVLSKWAHL